MANKFYQIEALEGWCIVEAHISCAKCKKTCSLNEHEPEEDAYNKGWRVIKDDVCACPSCLKKLKKKQKPKKKKSKK